MHLLRQYLLVLACLMACTTNSSQSTHNDVIDVDDDDDDDDDNAPSKLCPRCEWLLKIEHFHQVCYGRINRAITLKYKDQLISIDTAFAVWTSEVERNYYFVSFHTSALLNCTRFKYLQNHSFLCVSKPGSKPIAIVKDRMHCFDFSLQYVRELTVLCYEQTNKMGRLPPPVAFSALHYSASSKDMKSMSQATRLGAKLQALWSVLVPNVLVLLVARVLQMW